MKQRKKNRQEPHNPVFQAGSAIGVGLLAGLAGTAAITLSQTVEMKLTGREPSNVPADAVAKALDIAPTDESKKPQLSQKVHWTYGIGHGITRGMLSVAGLKGWPATLAHFTTVWGASLILLPALDVAPPIHEKKPKTLLVEALHHAVYAVAAGLVYDAITGWRGKRQNRLIRMLQRVA